MKKEEKEMLFENAETLEQSQALNDMLRQMVKNQKAAIKSLTSLFKVVIVCYTTILLGMVAGFFYYITNTELIVETTETITTTQEVSGDDSEINNVSGNLYKDNATHNEGQ